jgi:cobalt-zinc-cadmium efflux system outer membrane protein
MRAVTRMRAVEVDSRRSRSRGTGRITLAWSLLISVLAINPATSQDAGFASGRAVTLEEALTLFRENSLSLQASRADAAAMAGMARQAGAYSNPRLAFTYEPYSREESSFSETYLTLSQRIRWPGLGRARTDAAIGRSMAAHAQTSADSLRLAFEVVRTYLEAISEEQRWLVLRDATETIKRGQASWEARYEEGEVSGYDVRRMRVERARYENLLGEASLKKNAARRQLALMIFPRGGVMALNPIDRLVGAPDPLELEQLLARARTSRPETIEARALVSASRASIDQSRLERRPEPTLMAGLAHRSGGFDGVIVGVSLNVPVFDRNSGQTEAAKAQFVAAETREMLALREIEEETRMAHATYASLRARLELIDYELLAGTDDLMEIAVASYTDGELTLLELLDAAEAHRDAQLARIGLRQAVWVGYADLLRAAGGPLPLSLN